MRTTAWLGPFVMLALAACSPGVNTVGDGGDAGSGSDTGGPIDAAPCDSSVPCVCAQRGSPDYSHEHAGLGTSGDNAAQTEALLRANHWRTSAGLGALNANAQIEQAATAHAMFMVSNPMSSCWPGVHNEIASGCSGFTGTGPGDRLTTAGYRWGNVSEVINWEPTVDTAVDGWIWTVYHRLPFMNYQLIETGFAQLPGTFLGRASQFDIEDFAAPLGSNGAPPSQPAVFPVPGQTMVPNSFAGFEEGPTPPSPTGTDPWPRGVMSGTVVSVHFPGMNRTVTDHHLYYNGTGGCTDVEHTYVASENNSTLNTFRSPDVFLYGNQPLQGGSEYVVSVTGTVNGQPWSKTWAFTTQ